MQFRGIARWAIFTVVFVLVGAGCVDDSGDNNGQSTNNGGSDAGSDVTYPDGDDPDPVPESGSLAMGEFETPGTIVQIDVAEPNGDTREHFGVGHHVEISVDVDPREGWENRLPTMTNLHVGLVERVESEDEKPDARTCYLGSLNRDPRKAEILSSGVVRFSRVYKIPNYCLEDEQVTGTYNLWVALNPARFLPGENLDIPRDRFNTQFFNPLREDTEGEGRNDRCMGTNGSEGCIFNIVLDRVEGLNVTLPDTKVESDVFIFDGGMCEFNVPDYASPVARTSSSLMVGGYVEALEGLEDHAPDVLGLVGGAVGITYSLCPRGTDGSCEAGTDYLPVQAAVPDDAGETTLVNQVNVESMTLGTEHVEEASLYVEPGTDLCGRLAGWSDPDWSDYRLFNLRICSNTDFAESEVGGDASDDNCNTRMLRMIPIAETTGGTDFSAVRDLTKEWENDKGNDVLSVETLFQSENRLDTDGARSNTRMLAALEGWVDFTLFDAKLQARSYANGTGSGVNGHVEVLDRRLWVDSKDGENVGLDETVEFSKRACASYNYGIGGFGLNASFCAVGRAGVEMDVQVAAQDGAGSAPFDQSSRHGSLDSLVKPYQAFTLEADANVDAVAVRGGLRGALDVLSAELPISSSLAWGLETGPATRVTYDVGTDLVTRILDGYLEAYIDAAKPAWCDCGKFCGYPCRGWFNVVEERIVEFTARSRNVPLLDVSNTGGTTLVD